MSNQEFGSRGPSIRADNPSAAYRPLAAEGVDRAGGVQGSRCTDNFRRLLPLLFQAQQLLAHPLVGFNARSLSALFGPFQAGVNAITKLLEHCRP
jgi:hypothetical protein